MKNEIGTEPRLILAMIQFGSRKFCISPNLERIKEKNGGKKFYFFSSRSGSAFYPLQ
jgi:hypothetical protein